ncbi:MAG: holo-ACP synthase [Endomicrobium sp.]|jgi:holo-[acyl-carrier protein] synthase|uniref:holo-ACP synthase n=1 Tax=Candidatus Endomicrobiellum pyrsonymphae TaxID=1408203 RepID=UPI003575D5FC|nr:holo-ACP synthase [Endomicrobium sp.]MCA6072985.1 holo-ACP synthase [Endomicrobium sp.]
MNIGIDIEEVKRFNKYLKDKKYLERIFSKEEILYSLSKKNVAQHLAARFAAKEAVWKALSSKNKKLIATDVSIQNTKCGKPQVYIKNKKYQKMDVSLSHTDKCVVAVAIVF